MAREMDECPFCGEPIEVDAEFCRHCGSDAETGWNPDSDYESLELPEDSEEEPETHRPGAWNPQVERLFGSALVTGCWILFVAVGASWFQPPGLVIVPAAYLAACILTISKLAPPARRQPARR